MILILSSADDVHAEHLTTLLEARGTSWTLFNPSLFPSNASISIPFGEKRAKPPMLRHHDGELDLTKITAVWYRRPEKPSAHPSISDPKQREHIERESLLTIHDLWSCLDCRWLPAQPSVVRAAESKMLQLKLAASLGFALPATLITNEPAEVLDFYRRHGRVISKLATNAFTSTIGTHLIRYTEAVPPRDLVHIPSVAHCPMIFQRYVDKLLELRVTVVGTRVFAAEIHSQVTHHTRTDWRRYDHCHTPHRQHALPREVESLCIELTRALDLSYGAIDLILSPDNHYLFLEINPNGQYLWIEDATGMPISEAICDFLTQEQELVQ